jgi:predicted ArsR family transcriptional regulator
MLSNNIEEDILGLLEKHPEGMKIIDIANHLKTPRQTISKYVFGLKIAGFVEYKEVGRSKLCFLIKKDWKKKKISLVVA